MFHMGDAVIHPDCGPGRVIDIEQVSCLGAGKRYCEIELFDGTDTKSGCRSLLQKKPGCVLRCPRLVCSRCGAH